MRISKMIVLLIGVVLFLNPVVLAETDAPNNIVSLNVTLLNQDPYPAEPGEYVDLVFKVENDGLQKAEDVIFELVTQYPFSLDTGVSSEKDLGTISGLQGGENSYLIKYKVRVDKDAIDGENEIGIRYKYGSDGSFRTKTFDIEISDPKTSFEVIMEDSSEDSTTFAIANIGTNTAYSLIVTIPDQDGFEVSGAYSDIIGNLDAGDYTLTSFSISSSSGLPSSIPYGGQSGDFNMTRQDMTQAQQDIIVELSYTDELGIRRTVDKEVRLDLSSGTAGNMSQVFQSRQQSTSSSNGLIYIGIGVGGIIAVALSLKLWNMKKRKKKE